MIFRELKDASYDEVCEILDFYMLCILDIQANTKNGDLSLAKNASKILKREIKVEYKYHNSIFASVSPNRNSIFIAYDQAISDIYKISPIVLTNKNITQFTNDSLVIIHFVKNYIIMNPIR